MSEYGQMIAPYQTHGTGGRGVMDFIQDFMMQNQQRQGMQQQQELLGEQAGVDRQTRNVLNQQQGYAQGVDPFNMQKFAGTQQAQNQQGTLFDQQQSSRQSELDRVNMLMGSLRQNPSYQEDPLINAMLNSGNTPLGLDQVLPMLTGDRNLEQGREDLVQRNSLNLSNQLQLGEQESQLLIDRMLAMQPHKMDELSKTEALRRKSAMTLERQKAEFGDGRREAEAQSVRDYLTDPDAPIPNQIMTPEFIQSKRGEMESGLEAAKAQEVDDEALEKLAGMLGGGNNIETGDLALSPEQLQEVVWRRMQHAVPNAASTEDLYSQIVKKAIGQPATASTNFATGIGSTGPSFSPPPKQGDDRDKFLQLIKQYDNPDLNELYLKMVEENQARINQQKFDESKRRATKYGQ